MRDQPLRHMTLLKAFYTVDCGCHNNNTPTHLVFIVIGIIWYTLTQDVSVTIQSPSPVNVHSLFVGGGVLAGSEFVFFPAASPSGTELLVELLLRALLVLPAKVSRRGTPGVPWGVCDGVLPTEWWGSDPAEVARCIGIDLSSFRSRYDITGDFPPFALRRASATIASPSSPPSSCISNLRVAGERGGVGRMKEGEGERRGVGKGVGEGSGGREWGRGVGEGSGEGSGGREWGKGVGEGSGGREWGKGVGEGSGGGERGRGVGEGSGGGERGMGDAYICIRTSTKAVES